MVSATLDDVVAKIGLAMVDMQKNQEEHRKEIDRRITEAIERVFKKHKIAYKRGTAWTTDALYRETGKRTAKRLAQGATAVEMECASFAAAAKRMGLRFGQFLFFSDKVCEKTGWIWICPTGASGDKKAALIPLAVEIAQEIK